VHHEKDDIRNHRGSGHHERARSSRPAVPGDQRRWVLDFRVRLDQARGGRPIEMELRGDWLSTIVAARPGEYDAALQLADGRMAGAGGHLPPGVGRTFWATYREDGTLLAFHFYKDVDPSTRNLLQMIAGEMQLVEAGSSKTAWTETERDSAGEYLAIYNRLDSNRVVKRKVKYIYTDGASGAPENGLRVEIDESELCFTLAPEGQILAWRGAIGCASGSRWPMRGNSPPWPKRASPIQGRPQRRS